VGHEAGRFEGLTQARLGGISAHLDFFKRQIFRRPRVVMSLQLSGVTVPDDPATLPPYFPPSNTLVLASILSDIGASEFLRNFIDDEQDDNCLHTYKNPDRISKRYCLPPNLASIFVERSRERAVSASDRMYLLSHPQCLS